MKQKIIDFIRTHVGERNAVIGISGGIDSATVAALCVAALGAERVHGIIAPSDTNATSEMESAKAVIASLGISHETVSIDPILASFPDALTSDKAVCGNIKARIRMTLLYAYANTHNALVMGTGNKTELALGYFTKYGDGGVDILPIGDLYKHQVYALAQELNVPQITIDQKPTAGLWEGQFDEDEMGVSYKHADAILEAMEKGDSLDAFSTSDITRIKALTEISGHKLVMPPICAV